MNIADLVQETTTATDTSTITLLGATDGCRTFASVPEFPIGTAGIPVCVNDGAGKWENASYTRTGAVTLTREAVTSSSNNGAPVAFSAGTKNVSCVLSAAAINQLATIGQIAFATAIPLSARGVRYMPQQSVSGPLGFTVGANPVQGALVYLRLTADGTNLPTFSGFKEWGGSLGYDNRAGIINEVQFFYDGYDYWYTVSQAVGATAVDSVAPTASSAAVANATPTFVDIVMSEAMDMAYTPPASAVTVSGHTVSTVTWASNTVLRAAVSAAFVNGEAARTVGYTQPATNGARDLAGNLLASFSALPITNNVGAVANAVTLTGPTTGAVSAVSTNFTAALAPVGAAASGTVVVTPSDGGAGGTFSPTTVSLTTAAPSATFTYTPSSTAGAKTISITNNGGLSNPASITYTATAVSTFIRARAGFTALTESGTGPYTYTGTGAGLSGAPGAVFNQGLQAGVDGSLSMILQSNPANGSNVPMFGIMAGTSPTGYVNFILAIFIGGSGAYQPFLGSAVQTPANTVNAAIGDVIRLRRSGSGGATNTATMIAEVSKDGGANWTTIFTQTGQAVTALNFQLMMNGSGVINGLTGSGLA